MEAEGAVYIGTFELILLFIFLLTILVLDLNLIKHGIFHYNGIVYQYRKRVKRSRVTPAQKEQVQSEPDSAIDSQEQAVEGRQIPTSPTPSL